MGRGARRVLRRLAAPALVAAGSLALAVPALATPVTLGFDSGVSGGDALTNQFGPPAVPAGPVFKRGSDAGFTGLGCGPPHVLSDAAQAYSGSQALKLDGCPGGEFWPTAAFFSLGYASREVSFEVTRYGGTIGLSGPTEIWTTAFRADGSVVQREQTLLIQGLAAGAAYKDVPLVSSADDIAYVAVEAGVRDGTSSSATGVSLSFGQQYLVIDDLAYDPPSSPPASTFKLGSSPPQTQLPPGGTVATTINVNWTNNPNPSSSPVALSADAPPGMTAQFTPNPTKTGSAQLKLAADKSVMPGQKTVTVTGVVDQGQPSEKSAQVAIPVAVPEPFVVNPLPVPRLSRCTDTEVGVRVALDAQLTDPVTITASTSIPARTPLATDGTPFTGSSGYVHATLSPVQGVVQTALRIRPPPEADLGGAGALFVQVSVPGFAPRAVSAPLSVDAGEVSSIVFPGTSTPLGFALPGGFLRPPRTIGLIGRGFCPGSQVTFGSPGARSTPSSIASDARSLTVTLPRSAIDGAVSVVTPQGAKLGSPTALAVGSYRGRFGLSATNAAAPNDFYFSQFEQVFGYDAMHLKVDVCAGLSLGLLHCSATTPIPDPVAWLIWVALKGRGKIGLCYGFSLTSGEFAAGVPTSGFSPAKAPYPNALASPFDNNWTLLNEIETNHIRQWDANVVEAWSARVVESWGADPVARAQRLHQILVDELNAHQSDPAGGRPPIVQLQDDGGHAVAAYDVEDIAPGKFYIDVYDPNQPVDSADRADGATHAARAANSRILVDGPANTWTFPGLTKTVNGTEQPWGKDISPKSLAVLPTSATYFREARLIGLGQIPSLIVLASAGASLDQVTDASGRTLVGPRGAPTAGARAIPGARMLEPTDAAAGRDPIGLLPFGGTYDLRASGSGTLTAIGRGFVAQAHLPAAAHRAAAGAAAPNGPRLRIEGGRPQATAEPSGSGPLSLALATAHARDRRTVVLAGTARAGEADTVRVLADGTLQIAHRGRAATRTLTLTSSTSASLPALAQLGPLRLGRGERLLVRPQWRDLRGATIVRGGRRAVLRLRRARVRLIASARLLAHRHTATVRIRRLGGARPLAGGVTILVIRAHRVVARRSATVPGRTLRRPTFSVVVGLPKLPKGRYLLRAVSSLTRAGPGGAPAADTRAARAPLVLR